MGRPERKEEGDEKRASSSSRFASSVSSPRWKNFLVSSALTLGGGAFVIETRNFNQIQTVTTDTKIKVKVSAFTSRFQTAAVLAVRSPHALSVPRYPL